MDTLKNILKRCKKLLTKVHFFQELQLAQSSSSIDKNHRDLDIPKRLKFQLTDGLTMILIDTSTKLAPFLGQHSGPEIVAINANNLVVDLMRTLRDSYLVDTKSDRLSVDVNQNRAFTLVNFHDKLDFSFKRSQSQQA